MKIYIANFFGALSFCMLIISFWPKKRKNIFLFKMFDCTFSSLQYFLLGAITGGISNSIGIVRAYFFGKKKQNNNLILYIFLAIYTISCFIKWEGIESILVLIATIIYTIVLWNDNPKVIRLGACFVFCIWGIYDIIVGAYIAVLTDIIVILSNLLALYIIDNKKMEEKKMKFEYFDLTTDLEKFKDYEDILNALVAETECKHYTTLNEETKKYDESAKMVGYEWARFGSHREDSTLEDEKNRIFSMENSNVDRPVRFVITSDNKVWTDNTHWVIAYLLRKGKNTKIKDIPFYLVDFTHEIPRIIGYNGSVIDNEEDKARAIDASLDVEKRVRAGWRKKLPYNILDFVKDLELYNYLKNNNQL